MTQLSSVIGSILRDIISAQHEANLYSLSLSESYGKDGKTKDFQLPNVMLSDMELELRYGVLNASENQEQYNIKYSKFRQFIKELCNEAARTAITSAVSVILTSGINRNDEDKIFFRRLRQENELQKSFHDFLRRNMRRSFNHSLYEAIDTKTGKVLTDVVVAKLMETVRKQFLYDTDLDNLFAASDGKALRDTAEKEVHAALETLVTRLSEEISFKRIKSFPQLDVAVTADELSKMPEEAIHTFKLKFSPTNCNVTLLEDEEDLEDFVMS